ncbi:MAG: pilus assembly protein PilM [Candidatus Omnitrophota bacterium]|jgi:Tfp pilus assembly PilM family ATPase/Tfp pilus assembly protein PilN
MDKNILSIFNAKKVVGLYVSQDTVDLVVLKSSIAGPKLVKFGQTPIYPSKDARQEGEVVPESQAGIASVSRDDSSTKPKTREDYIIEAIKKVFRENNEKPGDVITAIPSEEIMVRYFQMPKIPKQERIAAVNFEAKRHIPFRMEDVVSDFQVLANKTTPNVTDVVFVAVKKDTIEQYMNILAASGLRPLVIESAPFSLMRAFNAAQQIDAKVNTAIVNIDTDTLNISILRSGVPYIIRDVAISEAMPEGKSFEPVFEKILAEIKLSFDFYEKQFPSEVIDKIIIYSKLPLENWHEIVGKELQIPVETGDPLRGIRVKSGVVPARAAVCFGLALRGLAEPFIDINLCKEKMMIYKKKELFLRMAFLEASAAVFLLIVLKIFAIRAVAPLTGELNKTLSERPKAEVNIKNDNIPDLEKVKNEMEKRKQILENLISSRTYLTFRLEDVVKVLPQNMWLSEISFEEKIDKKNTSRITRYLNIKGYYVTDEKAGDKDIVNTFLSGLKKSRVNNGMSRADIVSVKRTEIKGAKVSSFEVSLIGP